VELSLTAKGNNSKLNYISFKDIANPSQGQNTKLVNIIKTDIKKMRKENQSKFFSKLPCLLFFSLFQFFFYYFFLFN